MFAPAITMSTILERTDDVEEEFVGNMRSSENVVKETDPDWAGSSASENVNRSDDEGAEKLSPPDGETGAGTIEMTMFRPVNVTCIIRNLGNVSKHVMDQKKRIKDPKYIVQQKQKRNSQLYSFG